jgi:hypothetical protein
VAAGKSFFATGLRVSISPKGKRYDVERRNQIVLDLETRSGVEKVDRWREVFVRRDPVIVGWQFTARDGPREDPSRRVRCEGATAGSRLADALAWPNEKSLSNIATTNRSYPSLRDGSFSCDIPGSKLPGYYHLVPAGQNLRRPVHKIDSTSGLSFEHEDEKILAKFVDLPRKEITKAWT